MSDALLLCCQRNNQLLEEILAVLRQAFTAHSAILKIDGGNMPADILVGQGATAVLHQFTGPGGTGVEVAPIGPVTYTSSDPSIATVDASSGYITGVAVGTATITGTDAGSTMTAGDSVNVHAAVAVSATLVITPVTAAGAANPAPPVPAKPALPHQKRR